MMFQSGSRNSESESYGAHANTVVLQRRRTNEVQHCPVCLEELKFAVETNCGHLFCAQCIIRCQHERNWIGPAECPLCRQHVTVLFPAFSEDEVSSAENIDERAKFMTEVNAYNRRFSGEPRPLIDYIRDMPTMLRHLWNEFSSIGGLFYMFRIRVILCLVLGLLYLISPLDIIPEAIFGFLGLIDDLFVLFLILIYISVIYRRFLAARAGNFAS